MTIKEKREKRANLWEQAKTLNTRAASDSRDFTADEESEWTKLNLEIDRLGKEVEREERAAQIELELAAPADPRPAPKPNPVTDSPQDPSYQSGILPATVEHRALRLIATPEYRVAFEGAIRLGDRRSIDQHKALLFNPELRALQYGVGSEGGFLVPRELETAFAQIRREQNVMRSLARVLSLSATRDIPVVSTLPTMAWIAEEGVYGQSDPALTQVTLAAHKGGFIVIVSDELLQDSAIDLTALLTQLMGDACATGEEIAFVNGDGSGKPTGVVQGSTLGKTAAAAAAIAADELIDLFHSLKQVYRGRATFLMKDSTALLVRKLKETTNQYLWQPGLQAGQPDRLLGRPVATSDAMPAATAGLKSVLFGDFSNYTIADRLGISMLRLNELYAANGQVGFRVTIRVDGKVVVGESIKHLIQL